MHEFRLSPSEIDLKHLTTLAVFILLLLNILETVSTILHISFTCSTSLCPGGSTLCETAIFSYQYQSKEHWNHFQKSIGWVRSVKTMKVLKILMTTTNIVEIDVEQNESSTVKKSFPLSNSQQKRWRNGNFGPVIRIAQINSWNSQCTSQPVMPKSFKVSLVWH